MVLDFDLHQKMDEYTKTLFALYRRSKPLWQLDHSPEGFQWIDADNRAQSIFTFIRKGEDEADYLVIVCNFTPKTYHNYKVGVPKNETYREVLNSDDERFGGSGQINKKPIQTMNKSLHNQPATLAITVPPLGVTIFRPVRKRKGGKGNE